MTEYVLSYTGKKIDELLNFVDQNKSTLDVKSTPLSIKHGGTGASDLPTVLNNLGVYSASEIDGKINELNDETEASLNSIYNATPLALTRHYKMDSRTDIPWQSGTLVCDMNEDGSIFRLHGNAYYSSASAAWHATEWVNGTGKTWAGYKTFKVKEPSDGKVKWIDCAGIRINASSSLSAGHFNPDHICIGTDGYIYINAMQVDPENTDPLMCFYNGIICCVDSECNGDDYISFPYVKESPDV